MNERSSKYWQERFKQMEQAQNDTSFQKAQEIQEQFDRSLATINAKINSWYQRLADNNGVSMQQARKMLHAGELKEFRWNVEEYIKYGKENKRTGEWMQQLENASARVHIGRLEALKFEIQQEAEKLYGNCTDAIDQHIRNTYTSDFYHTAYEIQKGIGVGTTINRLDPKTVEKIVSKPWAVDGKNFSDRLWENKTKLINNVHNSLSRMCITGETPDRAITEISKQMGVSKAQAGRVVMTESAAFANKARQDCMKELDVEQFEVVETLDSHTCETCGGMDGKHFKMTDFEVGVTAPPFHPNCRGCTCPYFDDEFGSVGERAARGEDGKTYYVPADMTYEDWKKLFVDGDTEARDRLGLLTNNNKSNPRYYDFDGKDLKTVEQEISQNDYETAVCFDKNGKAIFAQVQEGTEHQVKFTKYQMSKMKGLDVTHNHPYGTPPSPEDLYNILINGKAKSIRACGKNGTYVLKYTKEIENLPPYDIFNQEYENYSDGLMDKYWKRINNKEITIYEAEIQMQEETWQYLSNKYDINYSFERR